MSAEEYNECVYKYSDNIYRFVLKSLKDEGSAKDIVQESFLRLWENRDKIIKGKEKSYLFTVAYRLMIDDIRLGKRFMRDVKYEDQQSDVSHYNDRQEILRRVLEEVSVQYRELILLRDYEDYSYKEISEITNLTESQVKVYIFRARMILRKKLEKIMI